jgi:uncharacterized membrane protein HdeD (DUF308 family)
MYDALLEGFVIPGRRKKMRNVNVRILLVRNWWLLALRGLIAVLLGLCAFVWPGVAIAVLVVLFGAFTLIHGAFTVWLAVGERGQSQRWWLLLIEGLVSIAVGVITFVWPTLTIVVLLYLVAIWACVIGLLEIVTALWRWRTLKHEWLLLLVGVLSLLLGLILLFRPAAGALALLWLFGAYAIIYGVLLLVFAFRLRNLIEVHQGAEQR